MFLILNMCHTINNVLEMFILFRECGINHISLLNSLVLTIIHYSSYIWNRDLQKEFCLVLI